MKIPYYYINYYIIPIIFLFGCASSMTDTQTIHNAEATRIWIIQKNFMLNDSVIVCDLNLIQQSGGAHICARVWSGVDYIPEPLPYDPIK